MRTKIRLLLVLAACVAGACVRLAAQESAPASSGPESAAPESSAPKAPATGKVLLLHSERTLEGDIDKVGDQYRIRRGMSEVWVGADRVFRLCADWQEVYVFMKARSNLADPDERLRLARWCQINGLCDHALAEAKHALEMRPSNVDSRQLVNTLERTIAIREGAKSKAATASATPVVVPPAQVDLSSEMFAYFNTKVQPILMNTCAGCHSGGRGGDFQLLRTDGGQRSSTQRNLAATLAQVNMERPVLSPLLIKAVSAHGNASNSPLKRQSVPYKTLQDWLDQTLASHPHLRLAPHSGLASRSSGESSFAAAQSLPLTLTSAKTPAAPKAMPAQPKEAPVVQPGPAPLNVAALDATPLSPPNPEPKTPALETKTTVPFPVAANAPSAANPEPERIEDRPANAQDPFDPAIFNRQAHGRN